MSHRARRCESWLTPTAAIIPENKIITNPEYTNTQQGLLDMGILSPLSRHAKLFGSGVYFAEKATNNGSLLSNFSLGLV